METTGISEIKNRACDRCAYYTPSSNGARFAKCERLPMRNTTLRSPANAVWSDPGRCGGGKWFKEAKR